jgi:PBP1b-binding outer membrane lipoprotein LpoB
MGRIISLDKAPRSKFVFPKNGDESLVENEAFTVQMKIINMQTGKFIPYLQTRVHSDPIF